jgi:hypothetical protein
MAGFKDAFDRYNPKRGDGGGVPPKLDYQRATVELDPEFFRPGVFTDSIHVTLRGLGPGDELAAARQAKGDGTALGLLLAKASIEKVDGEPINTAERDFLWSALTTTGRTFLAEIFVEVGGVADDLRGKARASIVWE